jgi:hypothetical protein
MFELSLKATSMTCASKYLCLRTLNILSTDVLHHSSGLLALSFDARSKISQWFQRSRQSDL